MKWNQLNLKHSLCMNAATSKNACIKTNLVVKCILECGFTQILQLYLGCHVWGSCCLVASDQMCWWLLSHSTYSIPEIASCMQGEDGVCEEIKWDTDLHAIIWFTIILLTVPSPFSFLKSKERAQTLVCGWSFCFLIKLDRIVRGIHMVDNVHESLH